MLLRPCRTSAAYEAIPSQRLALDLDAIETRLERAGWQLVTNARVLLVAKKDVEVTIFPSGKVLLKTTDRDEAQSAWDELSPFVSDQEAARGP